MAYNEDELDALTPEERAGLEDDGDEDLTGQETDDEQDDDQGDEGEQTPADDQDEGDQDETDDEGDDGAADDQDDQGDDDADDDGAAGRDDGQPADTEGEEEAGDPAVNPDRFVAPEFTLEEPKDVEDRIKALDTREDELAEKFDDGDISNADYRKALRELATERDKINREVTRFENAKDRHTEAMQRAQKEFEANWYRQVEEFAKEHPEVAKNKTVMGVFDQIVMAVNNAENLEKYSHRQRLEMAYKQFAEDLGLEVKPAAKPKAKDAKPKPKRADLPPTLSRVPAAQVQETDRGVHGTLDRLFQSSNPRDVVKAEEMLARMTPAEADRYLASQ